MEERENKREETASDAELQRLVEDFITQKQVLLIQVKKGVLGKEEFLQEAGKHIDQYYHFPATKRKRLLKSFEQYIFGYSRLSPLMDDKSISDIRVVSHDCIRIKREETYGCRNCLCLREKDGTGSLLIMWQPEIR